MALTAGDLDHLLVRQRLEETQLCGAAAATETRVAVLTRSLREHISITGQVQNVTLTAGNLSDAAHTVLNLLLLVLLAETGVILVLAGDLLLVVLLHAHAAGGLAVGLLETVVHVVALGIVAHELVRVLVNLTRAAGSLIFLRLFRNVVVRLIEVVRGRYIILVVFLGLVEALSLILLLLLLLGSDALRALRPVRRVAQRFALLDLLVDDREVALRILLVERCHAELLMDQSLLLASRGPVAIVRIVAEAEVVSVLFGGAASLALSVDKGVDGAHTPEEGLILCIRKRVTQKGLKVPSIT